MPGCKLKVYEKGPAMFGLFKKKQSFETLSSLTTREQRKEWLTSTPTWDQVAPPVVEAILDAITDKGLFEAFAVTSMTHDLVSRYEKVGKEETDKTLIRARISRILCQLGNKARVSLAEALKAKAGRENAVSNATLAEIAFESAIAMAKDQIVAYEGLSAIYGMAGDRAKCHDYANRGLAELADAASMGPMMSGVIPPEALNEMEQRLRQYLNC
jgi:hypothetical protein